MKIKGFIQVTDRTGKNVLIKTDHIVSVVDMSNARSDRRNGADTHIYTTSLIDQGKLLISESYMEVMDRINRSIQV